MYNHVVLIDDSALESQITKNIILKKSFAREVTIFNSAMAALVYLNKVETLPRVIILDLHMPIINGFQFLEHYAALPGKKRETCTLVVLTSSQSVDELSKARDNDNVKGVISKPFNADRLNELAALLTK